MSRPAGATNDPPWRRAGVFAFFEDLHPVHKDVVNPCGESVRIFKGRVVLNRIGIEYDDVREVAGRQKAALLDAEVLCWKRGQSAYRFLKRNDLFFSHILAKQSRKVAVGPRMSA